VFYILSKVFGYLTSPALWLLLLFLWPLAARSWRKAKRRLAIGLGILYLLMNPFLADLLLRWWEVPMVRIPEGKTYNAVIVPGGHIVNYDAGLDRYIFRQHSDRLLQAMQLYQSGLARKVVLSGGSGNPFQQEYKEAALLAGFLMNSGIAEEDVLYEASSRNTRENAVEVARLIRETGLSGPFLLLTSSAHMRRAEGCFRKAGLVADIYPVDKITGKPRYDLAHLFIPSVESFHKWKVLAHEVTGYVAYRLAGYASAPSE